MVKGSHRTNISGSIFSNKIPELIVPGSGRIHCHAYWVRGKANRKVDNAITSQCKNWRALESSDLISRAIYTISQLTLNFAKIALVLNDNAQ